MEQAVAEKLGGPATNHDLMRVLGIKSETSIAYYRREGLSIWHADRLAIELNQHPIAIWGFVAWIGEDLADDF